MCDVLKDWLLRVDFKALCDERNHEQWDQLILFADEMGLADRADIDQVKSIITEIGRAHV